MEIFLQFKFRGREYHELMATLECLRVAGAHEWVGAFVPGPDDEGANGHAVASSSSASSV